MNINQLKYIVTIAEELNITKASKKLFVSQSSLSQCIKTIEKEIGAKIFETNITPLKLTYAGEIYINWAKEVLTSQDEMMGKVKEISTQNNVRIIVGVATHRSIYLLPQVIKEFRNLYPLSFVVIKEYPTPILHKMLENQELDLLLDESNIDSVLYNSELLMREEIYLDIPKNCSLENEELDLADLKDFSFITLSKEQMLGRLAIDLCKKSKFEPNILAECRNVETAHSLVEQGLGVTFIPQLFVKYNNNVNYKKIKNYRPTRDICAIYSKKCGKYLEDFVSIIKNVLNN